jgi:hypothetical protein
VAASLSRPESEGDTIVAPPTIASVDNPEPPTNLNATG